MRVAAATRSGGKAGLLSSQRSARFRGDGPAPPDVALRRCEGAAVSQCARVDAVAVRCWGDLGIHQPQRKWGPALLPAPTAPSEGSAGIRNLVL